MKGPKIALHRDKQSLCLFLQLFFCANIIIVEFYKHGILLCTPVCSSHRARCCLSLGNPFGSFPYLQSQVCVILFMSYTMIYHCSFNYFLAVDIIFAFSFGLFVNNAACLWQTCGCVPLRTNLFNLKYRFRMYKHHIVQRYCQIVLQRSCNNLY